MTDNPSPHDLQGGDPRNSDVAAELSIPLADSKSLRQYWMFFSGQLFSMFGSSVVQFAIIWWLTLTSASQYPGKTGLILSLASVAGFAPFVLTGLFAGVLIDRWNRKMVIGVADAIQALVTGVLLVAFFFDFATIPVVLVILAVRAVAQGFHLPASQAIIILMVPKERLTSINSYQYLFTGLINLVGPVIGALAVELVGFENIATILWLDVLSFATAVIPLIIINIPDITKEKRENDEKGNFRSEFKEGIGFILNTKGLLPLQLTFTVINILVSPVFMLLPLVVISPNLLNGTAATLAIIMAASQGGSIFSSLVLTRRELFGKNVYGVSLGQLMIYVGIIIMSVGVLYANIWGVVIGSFVSGVSTPIANVHSQNIWQTVVPPELQGRVMSVRQTIAWLMIPLAQLAGGIVSDLIGPINLFLVGSTIGITVLMIAWYMTDFPKVESYLGLREDKTSEESRFLHPEIKVSES